MNFTNLLTKLSLLPKNATCDCAGTHDRGENASAYICRDPRLGPTVLPTGFPLLSIVSDYDRFGGKTPGEFLKQWTYPTESWKYPPHNGFQLNTAGEPILGNLTLQVGTKVDRFGSEYGSCPSPNLLLLLSLSSSQFSKQRNSALNEVPTPSALGRYVSAADAPYSQRSLPPQNLDTNASTPDYPYDYHIYEVRKQFNVTGGPIAPWFGQPGLGTQFNVGATGRIVDLLKDNYLVRVNISDVVPGRGRVNRCGLF